MIKVINKSTHLLIITLVCLLIGTSIFAQAPQKMSYQAVIRNTSGALVTSTSVGMKISILQGSETGTVSYSETQTASTNANGLVSLEIGAGTVVTGTFAGINWGNGPYFIKTQTDPTGGTNYTIVGSSQLLSVPYALFSANGTPGPQGPTGPIGATGAQGPIGLTGAVGATGPQGPIGLTGAVGSTGPQGPIGLTGAVGAQGIAGTNGNDGATGAQGPIGLTGAVGATGAQGPIGLTGAVGSTGPQGPIGLTGAVGAQGIAGTNGNDGATGAQGPIGLTGAVGATGAQGPIGLTGAVGATGPQGPSGSNGLNSTNNNQIIDNSSGNYSSITGMEVPNFLNYFGNGALGNTTVTNNQLINNNSMYENLTIPVGVVANINPSVRTVIYVKDTLYLYGTINGSGIYGAESVSNATSNHIGASATGFEFWDNQSYSSNGFSYAVQPITWEANSMPITFYESLNGSFSNPSGPSCFSGTCWQETNRNGINMTSSILNRFVHFGVNISGYNGSSIANTGSGAWSILGGQGGAGLYIIAKNIVFNGNIILNGGNGLYAQNSSGLKKGKSAAGGGGSCIFRCENLISNTGSFIANGGQMVGNVAQAGNGAMIIIIN